jgi:hypothetical protein
MVIKGGSGNVGIGTTSPTARLTVEGDGVQHDAIEIKKGRIAIDLTDLGDPNDPHTPPARRDFISMHPDPSVESDGSGHYVLSAQNDVLTFRSKDLNYAPGDINIRAINPNGGNVGIGTTEPEEKLSVVGRIESISGGFKFPDGSIQTTAARNRVWFDQNHNDINVDAFPNWTTVAKVNIISTGKPLVLMGQASADLGTRSKGGGIFIRFLCDGEDLALGTSADSTSRNNPVGSVSIHSIWTPPPGKHIIELQIQRSQYSSLHVVFTGFSQLLVMELF